MNKLHKVTESKLDKWESKLKQLKKVIGLKTYYNKNRLIAYKGFKKDGKAILISDEDGVYVVKIKEIRETFRDF